MKKRFRMDSWYELSSRHSCRVQAVAETRRESWFDLGQETAGVLNACYVPRSFLRLVVFFRYSIIIPETVVMAT